MKILLTNDDGWGAPGILALEKAASEFGEVWVVAPDGPRSGCGHQLTFETPLELEQKDERSFALSGWPADCARIGLTQLGQEFDWVLSGVNNGGNLGADIYVSGTVAAAREASLLGARAIALSQVRRQIATSFSWDRTTAVASSLLRRFLLEDPVELQRGQLVNINIPDLGPAASPSEYPVVQCPVDRCALPTDFHRVDASTFLYRGVYFERERTTGCDVDVCFSGQVSISIV